MVKEIAVLGGGIAGLTAGSALERAGHHVSIINKPGKSSTHYRSVYTTFQGPTTQYAEYYSPETLLPLDYFRFVSEDNSVLLDGKGYYMVDYPAAIMDLRKRLTASNIQELARKSDIAVKDYPDRAEVLIDNQSRAFDAVVDSTGSNALSSKENPLVEFMYGSVFKGSLQEKEMLIAFVSEIGCTCWANPSTIPGFIDLVVNAWGWQSNTSRFIREGEDRMKVLVEFLKKRDLIQLTTGKSEQRFIGTIASQIGTRPKTSHLYAAGDAARMAVPKTGDALRWAMLGAEVVAEAINAGDSPSRAYDNFYTHRPLWKDKLLQAAAIFRLTRQAEGSLGLTVGPVQYLLEKHPNFKNLVEDFFITEKLHPKLLLYTFAHPHFREIISSTLLTQLTISLRGIESFVPYYPLPELKK